VDSEQWAVGYDERASATMLNKGRRRGQGYYTLMASLPALGTLSDKQTPLNRIRLESRLGLLEDEDARELAAIEHLLHYQQLSFDATDEDVIDMAENLVEAVRSDTLREAVRWRIECRTVMAAIRRRASGQGPPEAGTNWGYGRWLTPIERNWNKSDFGLSGALPWIPKVNELVESKDALGVEEVLMKTVWDYFSRQAEGHTFDFEAVAFYVMRWNLLYRWSLGNPAEARQRFDELMEASWGEYFEE
jgi:hypothetical protein